jgi:hypothetical protein
LIPLILLSGSLTLMASFRLHLKSFEVNICFIQNITKMPWHSQTMSVSGIAGNARPVDRWSVMRYYCRDLPQHPNCESRPNSKNTCRTNDVALPLGEARPSSRMVIVGMLNIFSSRLKGEVSRLLSLFLVSRVECSGKGRTYLQLFKRQIRCPVHQDGTHLLLEFEM